MRQSIAVKGYVGITEWLTTKPTYNTKWSMRTWDILCYTNDDDSGTMASKEMDGTKEGKKMRKS